MNLTVSLLLNCALLLAGFSEGEAPLSQSAGSIVVQPTETNFVRIENRAWESAWLLQFPEFVTTSEGAVLCWPRITVQWKHLPDGWLGYEWAPPDDYPSHAKSGGDSITAAFFKDVRIGARLRPHPDHVELELTVTSIAAQPIQYVVSDGGCLQALTPAFRDEEHNRTFLSVGNRIVSLSELDRTVPIRSRYVTDSTWFEEPFLRSFEFFWGRSSGRPTSALIGTIAGDGRGAVGIAFDQAFTLSQNSDSHYCIHSSPLFGEVRPRQNVTRRGVVLFAPDIQRLFAWSNIYRIALTGRPFSR
jgi:hypothetical protein